MRTPRSAEDVSVALGEITDVLMRLSAADRLVREPGDADGEMDVTGSVLRAIGHIHAARKELARVSTLPPEGGWPTADGEERR